MWQTVEIPGSMGSNPLTAGYTAVITDIEDIGESATRLPQNEKNRGTGYKLWSEFVNGIHGNGDARRPWRGLPKYNGTVGEQVNDILRNGWPEGVEMLAKLDVGQLADFPPPVSIRRRQVWADFGDELDSDRYYAGRFEDMWRDCRRRAHVSRQVISIVVPWGGTADYTARQLQYNGLAVMLLSDMLESAGYETEIAAASGVKIAQNIKTFRYIVIKKSGDVLHLDNLAATVAHPAVFRTFGISMNFHSRYAMPGSGATMLPNKFLERLDQEGIIAPADVVMDNSYSESEAVQAVKRALEQLAGAGSIQLAGTVPASN